MVGDAVSSTDTCAPYTSTPDAKKFGLGADGDDVGQPAAHPQPTRYSTTLLPDELVLRVSRFAARMPCWDVFLVPRVPSTTSTVPSASCPPLTGREFASTPAEFLRELGPEPVPYDHA